MAIKMIAKGICWHCVNRIPLHGPKRFCSYECFKLWVKIRGKRGYINGLAPGEYTRGLLELIKEAGGP
jgi:hypothetical protein